MSTKHTPGPWRFEWDGSEAVIIGRPTWPCVRHRVKGEWQIAVTDDLIDEHPEESEANARLMAAAPELLESLKAMLSPRMDGPDSAQIWFAAEAAVAKAEGRT